MKWTVSEEAISAIVNMPIDFGRIWGYKWNCPIINHTVGTHNDSFLFVNSSAKTTNGENARTQEMLFENGKAVNEVPRNLSDYVFGLVKQVFSILKDGGIDLYELDRAGELY